MSQFLECTINSANRLCLKAKQRYFETTLYFVKYNYARFLISNVAFQIVFHITTVLAHGMGQMTTFVVLPH